MSCGCTKESKGNFSPLNATWTRQTSLDINNWQPYPELLNPKAEGCYGRTTENFVQDPGCCNVRGHVDLRKTWAPQKKYFLT